MKKYITLFLIILVLFASGCLGSKTPEEKLYALHKKSENIDKLHLSYDASFGLASMVGEEGMGMETDKYILGNRTKYTVSVSMFGSTVTVANYRIGGHKVSCVEGGAYFPGTVTSDGGISCKLGGYDSSELLQRPNLKKIFQENITIEEAERQSFAGRKAECFILNATEENIIKILDSEGETSGNLGNITVDLCLDKKMGYMAYFKIRSERYSRLQGKEVESTFMEFEATDFSKEVKEKDLEIPLEFALSDARCESNGTVEAVIVPFSNLKEGEISIKIKTTPSIHQSEGGATASVDEGSIIAEGAGFDSELKPFENKKVTFESGKELDGNYYVTVCVDGSCQSRMCSTYTGISTGLTRR